MKMTRRLLMAIGILVTAAIPSFAVPQLQLDVIGGTYDETTETIIGPPGSEITLVALLTPKEHASQDEINALLSETYYVSVALVPAVSEASELGSFTFDGNTVNATGDMVFGVPPIEYLGGNQGHDPGDLPEHGIFPTYFSEHSFQFSSEGTADTYNTADNPGGLNPDASGKSFYATFNVDTSALTPGYNLHFDLYSEEIELAAVAARRTHAVLTAGDVDVHQFAPFSHDAQTNTRERAPEPATLLLLGAGLLGLAGGRRLRNRKG